MLFIISWTISTDKRNSAITRFLKTGAKPPAGVTMKGRWHTVGRSGGFGLAETDDPLRLQQWMLEWSDLMQMEAYPALTDEQAAPLLAAVAATF
ncbi:DUF3303 domain-containing protein [Pseudomonas panipatensis]|jgi:hypothetical protein|uniref:DUF3303 domain-containing protein n=1 Tax=Pseudomonas panipatensis TaxID=428992 RepID=A0A1G8GM63_9PSED|nr:DUF3303 family protein [Pseudomonas panipatensis]SDH95479.1 Protein of unknown function [Pseudomonas panipatensis]SMP42492.1 Protein of unknown function [Pseudomonas panipatensis]